MAEGPMTRKKRKVSHLLLVRKLGRKKEGSFVLRPVSSEKKKTLQKPQNKLLPQKSRRNIKTYTIRVNVPYQDRVKTT